MREPAVADVMTRQVITAVPDTPFRELVGTLLVHDLSAIPVIDLAGRPVGVVTDIDTLTKLEYHDGNDYPPLFAGAQCRARWRKSSGVTAADLMTTPAPITAESAPLGRALHALATTHQLCVVDNAGLLTGTLTRHDALRLLLRGDRAIRADIERTARVPSSETRCVTVEVVDGVVTLSGRVRLHSTAESVCAVAHHVPGVVTVHNGLRFDVDDLLITGI